MYIVCVGFFFCPLSIQGDCLKYSPLYKFKVSYSWGAVVVLIFSFVKVTCPISPSGCDMGCVLGGACI